MIATNSIAIVGGTFDPIHNGHLHLIQEILRSAKFSKVVVVPAGDPWQKTPIAPALDRLSMVRSALGNLAVDVSDCEIKRNTPSYAIDTIEELTPIYSESSFTWVIGSDALSGLSSWHRFAELVDKVEFLVILRPGYSIDSSAVASNIKWHALEIDALDISATKIRELVKRGGDISALVPPSVADYIYAEGLYGAA